MDITTMTQLDIAIKTKVFIAKWGLKQGFVSKLCRIPETRFSEFLHGKSTITPAQLERLVAYVEDYEKRNG